ncbi:MAG TPA: PQQ-binding-like beta-propeller repeat protein [Thermoleophilaceae bacterium]|nr:PQQ-binding-like beta-propeller repeat protein [Thermoleophilaceae bacterium]
MIRVSVAVAVLVLGAGLAGGCGGSGGSAIPRADPSAAVSAGNWTTFGGSSSRAGVARGAPAHPHLARRFSKTLDGEVYAQPLIANGRIYVATENNTIYAFTTSGRQVWKRHLGQPVAGGELPCGNIDPSGITGAPVITGGRIYAVAFLHDGLRHILFGLRLKDGRVAVRVNADPPNRQVAQQRGALLASGGRIYIPYGGLLGDCGDYHGYVLSTTTTGRQRISYTNPAPKAGIWAPAGISRQSGTLLVSTGNAGDGSFNFSDSVIRLSPGLRRQGFWAPKQWQSLSANDTDESSLAPLPVAGGRVFQIGKDGVGYLLSHKLGGIGGELFSHRVCGEGAFGAEAYRAPFVIVQCGGGNYALRLEGDRFSLAWHNDAGGMVPVIAGDSVFGISRGGTLVQMRMSDGSQVVSTDVGGGATSFPQPAAAGNTLVAPGGRAIVVFSI